MAAKKKAAQQSQCFVSGALPVDPEPEVDIERAPTPQPVVR